jgi:hypothetical protein
MPILGIIASAITGNLVTSSYESIETVTVGSGGAANAEFTSIPATYTHLQVRMLVRQTSTSNGYTARLNSDTGSNYTRHLLIGTGSSVVAAGNANQTKISLSDSAISTSASNVFGVSVCDILDYSNTNKYSTVRTLGGFDNNGNGAVTSNSGLWMNTAAITSITITPDAGNFAEYSQFALYGIKGA